MSKEIYDTNGTRVRDMYSTGSSLEVYVWDNSDVHIWPDAQPLSSTSAPFYLGSNQSYYASYWPTNPSIATATFSSLHGIDRVYARGSNDNQKLQVNFNAGVVGSNTGNTKWENAGLNEDIPTHNLASITWPSYTNVNDLTPVREDTFNFKYYVSTLDGNEFWYDYNIYGSQDNLDDFDPSQIGAGSLLWGKPTMNWYGERLLLESVTNTIDRVSDYYVYPSADDYRWSFSSSSSLADYLRVYSTGRNLLWRPTESYGETTKDFLASRGRIVITIERNTFDPGNEYIIGWQNTYYPPNPRYFDIMSDTAGTIQYSDNPADQDSLTVVTGESVTYRIYEDII